jgi:hypothetical protein
MIAFRLQTIHSGSSERLEAKRLALVAAATRSAGLWLSPLTRAFYAADYQRCVIAACSPRVLPFAACQFRTATNRDLYAQQCEVRAAGPTLPLWEHS